MEHGLYIIATPIGNLGDITYRALGILKEAEIVACEDTRVTKKLFSLLGVDLNKKFITYQDHNEEECSPKILEILRGGQSVVLVSDAGSPMISDPGYKLVHQCKKEGIRVFSLPGACAVICAMQLSGLPSNRFMFAGFIPNKDRGREKLFKELQNLNSTLIFYETAPRILKTLTVMQKFFVDREIAVAREISKMYEECQNGTAAELIAHFEKFEPKGECVIVVAPPAEKESIGESELIALIKDGLSTDSLKDVAKRLSDELNLNKNEIYQLGLKIKNEI